MRKQIVVIVSLAIAASLFTGCGNSGEPKKENTGLAADGEVEDVYFGGLTMNGMTEDEFNSKLNAESATNYKIKYYDDLNTLLMALDRGDIENIWTNEASAEYIIGHNEGKYDMKDPEIAEGIASYFGYSMATKASNVEEAGGNVELSLTLNEAIKGLQEDGTLDKLKAEYIDDSGSRELPEPEALPVIEGADTYKVIITGDVPPMDYVTADGEAAGYNIALLSAISKKANINFELVTSATGSKVTALQSGKADILFWALGIKQGEDGEMSYDADLPDGITVTTPYLEIRQKVIIKAK
ncbi:MAG: transporter substrate-binding domain-containing protein [Lachnospiraceae bacterium]|nr:transporter substrate-binding domain-containing protein [Lachnospiraceae bacterium]